MLVFDSNPECMYGGRVSRRLPIRRGQSRELPNRKNRVQLHRSLTQLLCKGQTTRSHKKYPFAPALRGGGPEHSQKMTDMTAMRVSHSLESTLDSVNRAEEVATEFATKLGFDEDTVNRISMAVRE